MDFRERLIEELLDAVESLPVESFSGRDKEAVFRLQGKAANIRDFDRFGMFGTKTDIKEAKGEEE